MALGNFIYFFKMTPQKLVCDALLEQSSFPWPFIFDKYGALKAEKDLDAYLELIDNDPLMGLKEQGFQLQFRIYAFYHTDSILKQEVKLH